jgi:hypothetical protein
MEYEQVVLGLRTVKEAVAELAGKVWVLTVVMAVMGGVVLMQCAVIYMLAMALIQAGVRVAW